MIESQKSYINISNRSEIEIKGVKDILSYDAEKIVFDVDGEELILTGSNFYVKKLDVESGISIITGTLDALSFNTASNKNQKSFLASLFK